MAIIQGNSGDETLTGTTEDDTIFGAGGKDQLSGGDGNDRLVLASQIAGGGPFSGGSGTDTLVVTFLPSGMPVGIGTLPSSTTQFYGAGAPDFSQLSSIERLEFQASEGSVLSSNFIFQQFTNSGITEVVGGAGIDLLNLIALNGGTFTIPTITRTNWTLGGNFSAASDAIYLVGVNLAGQNFDYTLNASAVHTGIEILFGASGNDVLNGGDGVEGLNGKGGVNQLRAGGGDDIVGIQNVFDNVLVNGVVVAQAETTLTGAGSLFDGGSGTDTLFVGGHVNFQGTLQSVEGIFLQPAFNANAPSSDNRTVAELTISGQRLATLPSDLRLDGIGTIIVNLAIGDVFSGAGYTFAQSSNVQLIINAAPGSNNLTGTTGADTITGGAGDDTLIGGTGSDTLDGRGGTNLLSGGADNDIYIITQGNVTITENSGEGVDEVRTSRGAFTLGANVENLAYTGSGSFVGIGNELGNTVTGGGAYDELYGLAGNDVLSEGGAVADALFGGQGDDVYSVTVRGSSTIETSGQGIDEVRTTFFIYGLQANIENLTYTDNAQHGAGVGNVLDNVLTGGTGIDDLFGRAGNDTLRGGAGVANTLLGQEGDDIYVVAAVGDSVIEFAGQGTDTVQTALASFVLRDHVENLSYTGTATFTGIGASGDNAISGGAGADFLSGLGGSDILIGGSGADTLLGGAGNDQFRYSGGESGFDRILDFTSGADKIALRGAGFVHTATVNFIQTGAPVATSANSTFLYNVNTGILSYDADGNGAGAAVQLAQLNGGLTLAVGDFIFY